MKWYFKALVQNAVAQLPGPLAEPLYYQLQKRFGELKKPRFGMRLSAAAAIVATLAQHRDGIANKRVLEVGTGRTIDLPLGLWLMGAEEVVTVDITPLLRAELVEQAVAHIDRHWRAADEADVDEADGHDADGYRALFVKHADPQLVDERFDKLKALTARGVRSHELPGLLRALGIDYRAPADATNLSVADESIDVVVTFVVLQHVPRQPLSEIMRSTRRMLKKDGCMVHIANTGDHFAHADPSLPPLHFLRWSHKQWDWIAGNRFMYQNRMRADDYYELFTEAGLRLAHTNERIDERSLRELHNKLPLHPDWRGRLPERDAVIRFTALLERDDADHAMA